jgi:signal transduction histidine kinase
VENAQLAHPETHVVWDSPPTLMARFDPDRMAQLVSNLLSNARNHGLIGEPVGVCLAVASGQTTLSVANVTPPIDEARLSTLFDAFKPCSVDNARNPGGLGLGLYIASEVAKGHGGTLTYGHDGTRVTFTMTLPQLADSQIL